MSVWRPFAERPVRLSPLSVLRKWGQTPALRRQWLEALLAVALGALSLQLYLASAPALSPHSEMMLHAEEGEADMSLRNADFPNTYISNIWLDLTSPNHWVRVDWSGPRACDQETGPFRSSPGGGNGENDCNDADECLRSKSHCTPKGTRNVESFSDHMSSAVQFKFVTWFHANREIAFHSHPQIPEYPASLGCVRLDEYAAQLIHNNAVAGKTTVIVDGTWSNRRDR